MKAIEDLAQISRLYGRNKDFVIAGGGNTSFKTQDRIWVKPSGISLGSINSDGFAVLERKKVRKVIFNTYSQDTVQREIEVKNDLMASCINPSAGLRPSVETSLHEAIELAYVVHTHPYVVNALLCSIDAREKAIDIFGDEILYVPYTDPGYILSKKVFIEIEGFRKHKNRDPHIILLENHGIFVSANSIIEIQSIYRDVIDKIKCFFKKEASSQTQTLPEVARTVVSALEKNNEESIVKAYLNPLISHFLQPKYAHKVLHPLIPDQIVYCKAHPVYLEKFTSLKQLKDIHDTYLDQQDYPFKVLLIKDVGLFTIDNTEATADLVSDVFQDWMKISYYSEYFGGPHFLSQREIDFIDQWEVEHYRRKMVNKN